VSGFEIGTTPRILLAKPGMDGHNRGIQVVARALRDAGFEVIYLGIRRRPQEIVEAAVQEDVDLLGLSMLSGRTWRSWGKWRLSSREEIAVVYRS